MSSVEFDPVAIDTGEAIGSANVGRVEVATVRQGSWVYGSGADGDCHVNTNPFSYVSPLGDNLIVNNVLQRHANFASLTIDQACQLTGILRSAPAQPKPMSIFVAGAFTNLGILDWNADAASGITGGAGLDSATVSSFYIGGQRKGVTSTKNTTGDSNSNETGDLGAGAGAGGAGTGGVGGAAIAAAFTNPAFLNLIYLFAGLPRYGGAGGPSGGGDNTNKGGGGGAGGSLGFLSAFSFYNEGVIRARGGDGGTPPTGNCGGGGGGGGGALAIVLPTRLLTQGYAAGDLIVANIGVGLIDTSGGAGGNGVGTGAAGLPGSTGNVFFYYAVG